MRAIIISLLLFIPVTVWGQNAYEVNLSITDTLITVKESTRKNRYAAKVNVEINIPNLQDSLFLYYFKKYVPAGSFSEEEPFDEFYKSTYIGLNYIVEDKNQRIMKGFVLLTYPSFANPRTERRIINSRSFVTSKMQIEKRLLNNFEQRDYDLAKYEITNEKHSLILYALFGDHHYNLPKGEYYLYFVYVFKPEFPYVGLFEAEAVAKNNRIFKGSFVSNKVKLIVE